MDAQDHPLSRAEQTEVRLHVAWSLARMASIEAIPGLRHICANIGSNIRNTPELRQLAEACAEAITAIKARATNADNGALAMVEDSEAGALAVVAGNETGSLAVIENQSGAFEILA